MSAQKITNAIKKINLCREKKKFSRLFENDRLEEEFINSRVNIGNILQDEYESMESMYSVKLEENTNICDNDVCRFDSDHNYTQINSDNYFTIVDDIGFNEFNDLNQFNENYYDSKLLNKKINNSKKFNKKYKIVDETYEDYLDSLISRDSDIYYYSKEKWVYDVIDEKPTDNLVLYKDKVFCIVVDKKWLKQDYVLSNLENAHLLLIPLDKKLRTIRSLNSTHIPLLTYMKEVGSTFINKYFGIPLDYLNMYFHYKPSIYHLHIHVTNINSKKYRPSNINTHELDRTIYNLSIKNDYYQNTIIKVKKYD